MSMFHNVELRAFHATAHAGTMSAAARDLGLTQPTISAHIATLERAYGLELFFRRGRRVELTDFGHELLEVSRRLFHAEAEAMVLLQHARMAHRGPLRICAVGPYNVTPMIRAFRASHPDVKITVSVGDSRQIVERVLDYRGDVGVLVHAVDDPRILCLPYRKQPLVIFASIDHPLAGRASLTLRDLAGHAFVLREAGSTTRRVLEEVMAREGVAIRSDIEIGSREAVREAVAQGLGLGVVSEAAYLPDPRLVKLPIACADLFTHAHVVCLSERRSSRLVARFLDVATTLKQRD